MTSKALHQLARGGSSAISEGDVERIASRVVELLKSGAITGEVDADGERWVKAEAIARRFGVSRGWVYENAGQLGAIRLSGRHRGQLRFNPKEVRMRLEAMGRQAHLPEAEDALPIHAPRVRRRLAE